MNDNNCKNNNLFNFKYNLINCIKHLNKNKQDMILWGIHSDIEL